MDWCLHAFSLYHIPYSGDVKSAYRRVKVAEDHQWFQLLILFKFSKEDGQNYPLICVQEGLIFGACQAGTFLEICVNRTSKVARYDLAEVFIKYFRQVDNVLYSFKDKDQLYQICDEIKRIMTLYNLPR